MTLDHIEHEILRKEFDDPRIHAAIVCAARDCPPLRSEAYRPDLLDTQLEDQCRRFLSVPHRFRIDRDENTVYLSPILEWFAEDFVKTFGAIGRVDGHDESDSAALRYVMRYVNKSDAAYLRSETYRVVYLDYDWSLNEQD